MAAYVLYLNNRLAYDEKYPNESLPYDKVLCSYSFVAMLIEKAFNVNFSSASPADF